MPEIGPEHPITYRQELMAPLFKKILARESCAVIGAASMGKSRVLQFLLRYDVRTHYLADAADTTVLLWLDCNRIAEFTAWGLHELILTTMVEASGEWVATKDLREPLNQLRKEAILAQNGLLAQRHVELALQMLCQEQGLQLCLIFDEFDEAYRSLPSQALASLRALRDRHKYQLNYVLFLRDHPAQLRSPEDGEGFYELISRAVFGLQPYREADARRILQQITRRRGHELVGKLSEDSVVELLRLSGGHPGLLVALLDALIVDAPMGTSWMEWATRQPKVWEECRKIWEGLRTVEHRALHYLAQEMSTSFQERESLLLKGLIHEDQPQQIRFFSTLFQQYAASQSPLTHDVLGIDLQAGTVWVNGKQCESLTAKEFKLFAYLNEHLGEICEVEQMIEHLYPGPEGYNVNDNAIAALVRRIREKIEPNPKHPQYLLNVKGRGYRLVAELD